MTERYVPVSKLEEWWEVYSQHLPNRGKHALLDLIDAALTPETMSHAEMLATLKRRLERADDRDQREDTK